MSRSKKTIRPRPSEASVYAFEEADASFRLASTWGSPGVRVDNIAMGQDNPQQKIEDAFKKARYWFKYNLFVRTMTLLRLSFYDYGLTVNAAAAKWWAKEDLQRKAKKYIRDAWTDWLLLDNVVAVWRKNPAILGTPLTFPPEECDYKDTFGVERLEILNQAGSVEAREMEALTSLEKAELKNPKIILQHGKNKAFEFDVVKRERIGLGFGWPSMAVLFQTCSQNEGIEVGDSILGNLCRNVIEQHQVGHDIKSGTHAGSPMHFLKKPKAKAIETNLKGKVGHIRFVTNFDHKIVFVQPPAEGFDAKRYDGIFRRLEAWAMPLAQMVFSKGGLNPYLLHILKLQAEKEREIIAPHFNRVLQESLNMPPGGRVEWSSQCFEDTKIAADFLKFGLASGPLSQQTFLERIGYDPEKERERKAADAKLPESQTRPIYDPHHGPPKEAAGRKRGTKDGQGS